MSMGETSSSTTPTPAQSLDDKPPLSLALASRMTRVVVAVQCLLLVAGPGVIRREELKHRLALLYPDYSAQHLHAAYVTTCTLQIVAVIIFVPLLLGSARRLLDGRRSSFVLIAICNAVIAASASTNDIVQPEGLSTTTRILMGVGSACACTCLVLLATASKRHVFFRRA